MSESKKIIKIGELGMVTFEFESRRGAASIRIDVAEAHDAWLFFSRQFLGADGKMPTDSLKAFMDAKVKFVRDAIAGGMGVEVATPAQKKLHEEVAADLGYSAALAFHKHVEDEVAKLKDFFVPRSGKEPSPPPSSKPDVEFSE